MREVFCSDVIEWLNQNELPAKTSLVASIPDISEFHSTDLNSYRHKFCEIATLILNKTPEDGVTIFYQSDIKTEGLWLDKAYLCQKAAESVGAELLFHKMICRVPPGTTTFGRPAYTHIVAFSKKFRVDSRVSTPDIIPQMGEKLWERGMGANGAKLMVKFIKEVVNSPMLVNCFSGMGTLLAVSEAYGLKSIGLERSTKRVEESRLVRYDIELEKFL